MAKIKTPGTIKSRGKVAKTSNAYKDVMVTKSKSRTSRRGKTAVKHTEEHNGKPMTYVYPTSSVEAGYGRGTRKYWSKTRKK